MTNQANPASTPRPDDYYPAIIDYVNVLFRWRRFIVKLVFSAGLFAVGYSLIMPKTFNSTAVIMPTQQDSPGGTFESFTGQLLGMSLGGNTTEIFLLMALLDSRTLAENIILEYGLQEVFATTSMDESVLIFGDQMTVTLTEDNTLKVSFAHRTGWLAFGADSEAPVKVFVQEIASAIVAEMDRLNRLTQGSEARNYREFIEERRKVIMVELAALEDSLTVFQRENDVSLVDAQVRATFEAAAAVEATLMKQELDVAVAKAKLGADSPMAATLDEQLRAGKVAFRREFGGHGEERRYLLGYDRDLPTLLKHYLRLQRNIMIQSELFAYITTKFEESKLQEAQDIPTINVLDYPSLPDKRSAPRRGFMVITTGVLMSIMAVILALSLDFLQRSVQRFPDKIELLAAWPRFHRWIVNGAGD